MESRYGMKNLDFDGVEYKEAEEYVFNLINELHYPKGHPFVEYPNTPDSINLFFIIILKMLMGDEEKVIIDLLKKCKAIENNKYSHKKYLEGLDEVLVLYYIVIDNLGKYVNIIYEPDRIFDNDKKLEYSLINKAEQYIVNFEVKTMLCDPFIKENNLPAKDGTVLIKRLVNDNNIDITKIFPEAIELKNSVYYSAFKRNIRKIIEKFDGKRMMDCKMINIGFVCIHFSTSIEEFYAYLFHEEKGIFQTIDWGNLDALVLFASDARNDIKLDNLYQIGYIKTILLNEDAFIQKHLHEMRLDNYVSKGRKVPMDIYEEAQKSYALYKVMNREGYLNIIPYESTEEEIGEYIEYLKGNKIRY